FVVRYLRRPQFVSLIIRAYYRCGPDLCNKALQGDMPAFASQRLVRFDEHVFREKITQVAHLENARIDLSLVAGTEHPDYYGSTWAELIGLPPGHDRCVLKRLNLNLHQLAASAEYYLSADKKEHWSFYLLDDQYFISSGNHRTVLGRFLLELNGLPAIVHGVSVTVLRRASAVQVQAPAPASIRQRLMGMFS
ncbi:hypothetical protein, partial [Comamonas sp. 4034]